MNMRNIKIGTLFLALALIFSLATPAFAAVVPSAADFTDIPAEHKNFEAIDFCAGNKFVYGRGDGKFDPDGPITRGEFITVWARTFHVQSHDFDDATKTRGEVDNSIVIMQGMGYINGVSNKEFSIGAKITREQVAKIAQNTYLYGIDAENESDIYTDKGDISSWALSAVDVCTEYGVFEGVVSNTVFKPKQNITRAEVCQVIFNLLRPDPETFSITIDSNITDGVVSSDKDVAAEGETITVTVTPDSGMRLVAGSLKYNSVAIAETEGVYSFDMPAEDVVITAEFETIHESYTITVDPAITGGSISADKGTALEGETITVTVTPDSEMQLVVDSLKYNSTVITETEGVYSFDMPAEDVVITAEFETIES